MLIGRGSLKQICKYENRQNTRAAAQAINPFPTYFWTSPTKHFLKLFLIVNTLFSLEFQGENRMIPL